MRAARGVATIPRAGHTGSQKGDVMQSILLAYDGSEGARRALERTAELANGATVTVVSGVSFMAVAGRGNRVDPDEVAFRRQNLAEASAYLEERGIRPHTVELHAADVAGAVARQAEEDGADLIVVGSGGKNLAKRLALGSTSTAILHKAACDVLVVR